MNIIEIKKQAVVLTMKLIAAYHWDVLMLKTISNNIDRFLLPILARHISITFTNSNFQPEAHWVRKIYQNLLENSDEQFCQKMKLFPN